MRAVLVIFEHPPVDGLPDVFQPGEQVLIEQLLAECAVEALHIGVLVHLHLQFNLSAHAYRTAAVLRCEHERRLERAPYCAQVATRGWVHAIRKVPDYRADECNKVLRGQSVQEERLKWAAWHLRTALEVLTEGTGRRDPPSG
jgi:hypothetical protein